MNKGIVMEINESNIIVMTSSGRFDKLPKADRSCEVGEEIVYADTAAPRRKVPPLAIGSGLVAAAVLCFVLITGLQATTAKGEVVAYVSIDINPSIEIGIDSQEIVRDLRGINADGIALIANLEFKGKNLEDVTAAILDKAEQGALAKGEGEIVISSTIVQVKTTLNDEAIADKLKIQVAKHIESAHPTQVKNYEVTAFAAPVEIRNEAKASGVTAGKYAVYLNALDNGTQITIDEIQNKSIQQWAKDNGGMNTLIDPVNPITKTTLKELLDEEKSRKLSEKVQATDKSNDNKTNNNIKNNDNNGSKNNNSSKNNQDDKTNQNDKNNQSGKPSPTSNKNSSWSDFLLNRGNINSNNDTKTSNTNNDNNKNDNNKNSNSKNGSSNANDNKKITDQNGNTNKNTDKSGNTNKNNDPSSNTNKNNDPNKDNNKSDSYKNGDNQKGGSSSDNQGASLKPSPTKTPPPKPKPKDRNNSNPDGNNKDQQADRKQGDSSQGDNNGSGN